MVKSWEWLFWWS